MPIKNTVRLTQDDVDDMNDGFRALGYRGNDPRGRITDDDIMGEPKPTNGPDRQGRRIGLAEYFGGANGSLKPISVVAWLTPPGQFPAAKNIVIARDGRIGNNPPYVGAIGRRLVCLKPAELEGPNDPLNGLRDRILLAARMGVQGGITREPILTGRADFKTYTFPMLSSCIKYMKSTWDGKVSDFFQQAWTSWTISGVSGNWVLTMTYNQKAYNQEFYNEEMSEDPTDEIQHDGSIPVRCP